MEGYITGVFIITLISTVIVGALMYDRDTVCNALRIYFAPLNNWWSQMVTIAVSIYFAL